MSGRPPSDPAAAWPGALAGVISARRPSAQPGWVTLFHSSWGRSRLPPAAGFLKTQTGSGALFGGTQNIGRNHIRPPHQRELQGVPRSRHLNSAPSRAQQGMPPRPPRSKDLARHSGPTPTSDIRGSSPPPLGAASPPSVPAAETLTCLHLCKCRFRWARRLRSSPEHGRGSCPPGAPSGDQAACPPAHMSLSCHS